MGTVTPAPRLSKNAPRTALFPVPLSACRVSSPCWRCGALTPDDGKVDPLLCRNCKRMAADSALNELFGHARALLSGSAPFHVLTSAERMEQLAALIGASSPHDPAASRCSFDEDMTNEQLIELAGAAADEIARRLGHVPETAPAKPAQRIPVKGAAEYGAPLYDSRGYSPTPEERDDIESRIEATPEGVPAVDPYFRELDEATGIFPHIDPINLADYAAKVCGFRPDFTPHPAA